jgi:hypothetical protein
LNNQEKLDQMYKFYTEVVFEELKTLHSHTIKFKLQEELNGYRLANVLSE